MISNVISDLCQQNVYRAGKLMEFFRGGALGANIGNELAHCVGGGGVLEIKGNNIFLMIIKDSNISSYPSH